MTRKERWVGQKTGGKRDVTRATQSPEDNDGEVREQDEEDRDDEPFQDGWTAPGRLRVRKGSGAQDGANKS